MSRGGVYSCQSAPRGYPSRRGGGLYQGSCKVTATDHGGDLGRSRGPGLWLCLRLADHDYGSDHVAKIYVHHHRTPDDGHGLDPVYHRVLHGSNPCFFLSLFLLYLLWRCFGCDDLLLADHAHRLQVLGFVMIPTYRHRLANLAGHRFAVSESGNRYGIEYDFSDQLEDFCFEIAVLPAARSA